MKPTPVCSVRALAGATVLFLALPSLAPGATLTQYWPLDEAPGATNAPNRVAGGAAAALVNADPTGAWLPGGAAPQLAYSTSAVSLDGVDDYLDLGVVGLSGSGTISLWINPASSMVGDMRLITTQPIDSGTYGGLVRFDALVSGNLQVASSVPGQLANAWLTLASGNNMPAGQWTHLAFVYAGGTVTLYANGVKVGANFSGCQFDRSALILGSKFAVNGNCFVGGIDDVSIWNGPLGTNAISRLAAGVVPTAIVDEPPAPQGARLVQYLPLDDASGSLAAANAVPEGNPAYLSNFNASAAWTTDVPTALAHSHGALVFDGAGYVNLGNLKQIGSAAVSLWLKPATNDADIRIYSQITGPNTVDPGLVGFVGMGGLQVYNSSTTVRIAPDGSVPANSWTHVVVNYDQGYATAFINGVPQITTRAVFAFNGDNFGLGASYKLTYGRKFAGVIDDVSIWDRALSPTAIRQLAGGVAPTAVADVPEPVPAPVLSLGTTTNLPGAQLVQYFPLEGPADATTAANAVAGGNVGKLVNYVAPLPPWTNSGLAAALTHSTAALALDGLGNYANLGNVGLSAPASVSLWFKPNVVTNGGILFGQLSGTTALQGGVGITGSGGLMMRGGGEVRLATNGTLVAGQWTHLVIRYDIGTATAFINGTNMGTVNANCNFDTEPFGLGAPLWALNAPIYLNFGGQMDDVSLYLGALSDEDIASLAAGASPLQVTSASLAHYYPLDGSGANLEVADLASSGSAGQLVNYPTAVHSWDTANVPPGLPGSTRSLFMNGLGEFLNLGNIGLSNSATISLWLKPTTLEGDRRLLSQLTGASSQAGAAGYRTNGEVWAWSGSAYVADGLAGTMQSNRWYHLLFTAGGGQTTLFVNGIQKGTVAANFHFTTSELGLGSKFLNQYGATVAGYVDDVSIWDRPVSPETVLRLAGGAAPNSIADVPRNVVFTWPAYPGGYYVLQTATNLLGPWTTLSPTTTLVTSNYTASVPLVRLEPARFYRLARP